MIQPLYWPEFHFISDNWTKYSSNVLLFHINLQDLDSNILRSQGKCCLIGCNIMIGFALHTQDNLTIDILLKGIFLPKSCCLQRSSSIPFQWLQPPDYQKSNMSCPPTWDRSFDPHALLVGVLYLWELNLAASGLNVQKVLCKSGWQPAEITWAYSFHSSMTSTSTTLDILIISIHNTVQVS